MANTNAPFGLRPSHTITGAPYNGQATMYYVPSTDGTAFNVGDIVTSAAGGDLLTGAPAVALFGTRSNTSTSGNVRGVVVGFGTQAGNASAKVPLGADAADLTVTGIPATKTQNYYVWVCDDPSMVFEAQTNTIAATAFNKNTGVYIGAAPTAPCNVSQTYIDGASATTTSTLPIKIIGAPNRADNDLTSPGTYARIYVMLNTHELTGAQTVGV